MLHKDLIFAGSKALVCVWAQSALSVHKLTLVIVDILMVAYTALSSKSLGMRHHVLWYKSINVYRKLAHIYIYIYIFRIAFRRQS